MPKITSCQITAVDDKKDGRYLISTKSTEGEWSNTFSSDIEEDVYHLKCMIEFANIKGGLQNIKKMEGKKVKQITNELEVIGHGNGEEYALLNECGKFTARQVKDRIFY